MTILLMYAQSLLGTPYRWGGRSPIEGLDCSGLVLELLKSAGVIFPTDQSAQSLFNYYSKGNGSYNSYRVGSLAFYGRDASHVSHVAMLLDRDRIIEAGSGDQTTLSLERAIEQAAFVRVRTIGHRTDLLAIIRPYYLGNLDVP